MKKVKFVIDSKREKSYGHFIHITTINWVKLQLIELL